MKRKFGDINLKEYVLFHLQRNIINLYKRYIIITEDLRKDHKTMLSKAEKETSKEFVENIDYFNDDKYTHIRKRILDSGNEMCRDLERHFELLDLELDSDKIDNLRKFKLSEVLPHTKQLKVEGGLGGKHRIKGKLI